MKNAINALCVIVCTIVCFTCIGKAVVGDWCREDQIRLFAKAAAFGTLAILARMDLDLLKE